MNLMTKEIEKKFEKFPIGSQDGKGYEAKVVVKYFNPCGAGTWLITEGEKRGDDWLLFGYCHIHEWEWGYVSLNELKSIRLPFRLSIERDLYVPDDACVGMMVFGTKAWERMDEEVGVE